MTDNLTREQRSYCMSRVKGKDTGIEQAARRELHRRGRRFRKHVRGLPGTPDVVFLRHRVALFIDGDFWHGWRFPLWRDELSAFWQEKIQRNRERDQRNFRRLRRAGWRVIRLWQHQLRRDFDGSIALIEKVLSEEEGGRGGSP